MPREVFLLSGSHPYVRRVGAAFLRASLCGYKMVNFGGALALTCRSAPALVIRSV